MECTIKVLELIFSFFTALGTVGAVILALSNQNPKFRIVKRQAEVEDITRIGFSNKKQVKFQKIGTELSLQPYKKNYQDDELLDKITYFRFPVKIQCGEMIVVIITKEEMLTMKENLYLNRIPIRIIFADETVKKIYLTKKEIDKYLEDANNYNG